MEASQTWNSLGNFCQKELRMNDEIQQEVGGSSKEKSQERQGILRDLNREEKNRAVEDQMARTMKVVPTQYDLLYQDAMARIQRHQRIQSTFITKDCTFEPKINRLDQT